jgi:crossover junction endodeoxyribonuclease RusA
MTNIFQLTIPFPPSVNTYWGFRGSHRYLTSRAKIFKSMVSNAYVRSGLAPFGDVRLKVIIELYPPDRRVRDIDNVVKSTLDALCQCGIFTDDGQIDVLHVTREKVIKWGVAVVNIEKIEA